LVKALEDCIDQLIEGRNDHMVITFFRKLYVEVRSRNKEY
jgi:hypothetical protein